MMKRDAKIFGILGTGISYSLSPSIFDHLFKKHGLPHGYHLFDIADKSPERFIDSVKLLGIAGFNVTVPFKCSIIPYLDALNKTAESCCAVNLVKVRNGLLTGYNTDLFGISSVFNDAGILSVSRKRILIIGAGGTARTALRFFQSRRTRDITIINRGRPRLLSLLQAFDLSRTGETIRAYESASLRSKLKNQRWNIVFNATPVPTEQIVPRAAVTADAVIYEASYARKRRLVQGQIPLGGIDMLVYQAIRGFEILTGNRTKDYRRTKAKIRERLKI